MPDLSRPEYASYVELCRSLRLEREWQDGDAFAICGEDWIAIEIAGVRGTPQLLAKFGEPIWLPQLSDWLDMLEATGTGRGANDLLIENVVGDWAIHSMTGETVIASGQGPTREEAAARLAIAVGAVSPVPT